MPTSFYDELAPYYHLLYGDWEASVAKQGRALAALLKNLDIEPGSAVLDAACGIGTQTLGLLQQGYRVSASDISPGSVERLRNELFLSALEAPTEIDDLRTLTHTASESMDAVLACDNSIPHLLTPAEILQAFRSMLRCLRPGGVAVISVRDYGSMERRSPDVRPYGLHTRAEGRFLAVQVWEWEGDHYDMRVYLTSEAPDGTCKTRMILSRYYAITIEHLLMLMEEAGFVDIRRTNEVLFQPVLVGRRPLSDLDHLFKQTGR